MPRTDLEHATSLPRPSDQTHGPRGPVAEPTLRLRARVAYDGTEFHGWARQPDRRTVQGVLSQALGTVLGLRDVPAMVCAGRTDAGVHALDQWIHCDLPASSAASLETDHGLRRLIRRWNGVLPQDVSVRSVDLAPPGFDARFSVSSRTYRYRIADSRASWNPLLRADTLQHDHRLDVDAMHVAAQGLLGEHDFAAFCRRRDGASTVRTVLDVEVRRTPEDIVEVLIEADAFCHSMVRSVVGALLAVGDGRMTGDEVQDLLEGRQRTNRITVAPPHGLTLFSVRYPSGGALAEQAMRSRRYRLLH